MTNETLTAQGADGTATNSATMAVSTNSATMAVSTNAPPVPATAGGDSRGSRVGSFPVISVVALAAVGIAAIVIRKLRTGAKTFDRAVRDALLEDVLDVVAKGAPNRAELRAELAAAIAGTGSLRAESLVPILRIEEAYEKRQSGKYLRRVSILRRKDGTTGVLAKVESEVGWEYVPDAVRAKFIETREEKVVRLVYAAERKADA